MKKHLHSFLLLLIVSSACTSCSVLTKQQKVSLKEFAGSAKAYTDAPKALLSNYGECLNKAGNLSAVLAEDSSGIVRNLNRTVQTKLKITDFTSELNQTYNLMSKYYQALLILADVDTASDIKSSILTLGINIDSLISKSKNAKINTLPLGFGTITGNLAKYVGKRHIQHKQLEYLKEFTQRGSELIETASYVLDTIVIGAVIKGDLENENQQIDSNFLRYVSTLEAKDKTPSAYYKDLDPIFTDSKTSCGQAIQIMNKLIEATVKLPPAQKELVQLLQTKQSKFLTPQISSFIESVDELNELISIYTNQKNK